MRHRMFVFVVALTLALAGCATTSPYGNYLQSATVDQQKLAGEAVKQLATFWPPARTRFELQQATPDAFGAALVAALRESGYALLEFNPAAAQAKASAEAAPDAEAPVSLGYVLDQAGAPNLYRLTLTVGNQSISRLYREQDGELAPAGYWAHQE